jgi:glycine/D-amino acid oxidase-like deaminating enzyme
MKSNHYEVIVVGGGIVGSCLAYGLLSCGARVLVLDGADSDLRAAKANFGLVGVQGKGTGAPAYQLLSRRSVALWPAFAATLYAETGIDVEYRNNGCLAFCTSEAEFVTRETRLARLNADLPDHAPSTRMLDRAALESLLPGTRLGPKVWGAGLGMDDGHANPLKLLRAVQQSILDRGGDLLGNHAVTRIDPGINGGFKVLAQGPHGTCTFETAKVIISAGLGSATLGAMVGLDVPLRPQRGQILVTERLAPLLAIASGNIRQTHDGTVMIGTTQEEVGMDLRTTTSAASRMSRLAIEILPDLEHVKLVRQWSSLRIMTPDGFPVYAQSTAYPGAWIALCHSGITLAAYHAGPLAEALAQSRLPADFDFFHPGRLHVSKAI